MSKLLSLPGSRASAPTALARLRHLHARDLAMLVLMAAFACISLLHAWSALDEMRAQHQKSQDMIRLIELALLVSAKADAARASEADLNYALLADQVNSARVEQAISRFQSAQSDLQAAINGLAATANDDAWTLELLRILRGEQGKFVALQSAAARAIAGGDMAAQRAARTQLSDEGWKLAESVSALTQTIALNFSRAAGQLQQQAATKVQALRWRIAAAVVAALILIGLAGWLSNRAWRAAAVSVLRLERQSLTDPLTGLPNRRAFHEHLHAEIARAKRNRSNLVLVYLDLDHFKHFNDTHGHPAGDQFLRDAALQWQAIMRPSDVIARIGGEEFAIVMPGCTDRDAQLLIDRVRAATPQQQTFSAGFTQLEPEDTAEQLIARADGRLYRAKRGGRDRSAGPESEAPSISLGPAQAHA
jgi:diguanylate cyclase (GGDEF)-like protein